MLVLFCETNRKDLPPDPSRCILEPSAVLGLAVVGLLVGAWVVGLAVGLVGAAVGASPALDHAECALHHHAHGF